MGIAGQPLLPDGYDELLGYVKAQVRTARLRAHLAANAELLRLYWEIGRAILDRQEVQGWGARVLDRLGADLRAEFPGMKGLSRSNLHYMRKFAGAWPDHEFVQRSVGQLPWGHITVLLDKLDDPVRRDWYARAAVEGGWTRDVLAHQIAGRVHARIGAAPSNFGERLPAPDSELAGQVLKDPYVFDFLDLTERADERRLENALVDHLSRTLLEFGHGFAYVGRQVHFDVDGKDYYLDLLLFHVEQLRYVVVELKVTAFEPEHAGKLGFYVALVDDVLRRPAHAPTLGLLLCADAHGRTVRYALSAAASPVAVATYTYDSLPPEVRACLPPDDVLASALDATIDVGGRPHRVLDLLRAGEGDGG